MKDTASSIVIGISKLKLKDTAKGRKRQPYFIICGKTKQIFFKDEIAYIL